MTDLKVGDVLAFSSVSALTQNRWRIHTIDKITPTGRIKCGPHVLNPDLSMRGRDRDRGAFGGPYRGERMTPKIREEINRDSWVSIIKRADLEKLDSDTLRSLAALVNVAKTEGDQK